MWNNIPHMEVTSSINNMCQYYGITSLINNNVIDKNISDTLLCVYKSLNPNIFSDLRKSGLVPGESLSLSTKIDSVLENNSSYIDTSVG